MSNFHDTVDRDLLYQLYHPQGIRDLDLSSENKQKSQQQQPHQGNCNNNNDNNNKKNNNNNILNQLFRNTTLKNHNKRIIKKKITAREWWKYAILATIVKNKRIKNDELWRNLNIKNNGILTQLRILIQQNNNSILGLDLDNALIDSHDVVHNIGKIMRFYL